MKKYGYGKKTKSKKTKKAKKGYGRKKKY